MSSASVSEHNGTHCHRYERLERLRKLLRAGDGLGIVELAQMTSTSVRTVYRDLRALQHTGCAVCQSKGRYTLDPSGELESLRSTISKREAISLVLAVLAGRTLERQPFYESLERLATRLMDEMAAAGDRSARRVLRLLLSPQPPRTHDPGDVPNSTDRHFLAITRSIVRSHPCVVEYFASAEELRRSTLRFKQLFPANGRWFALATDDTSVPVRIEVIRICRIGPVPEPMPSNVTCRPIRSESSNHRRSRSTGNGQIRVGRARRDHVG